MQYLVLRACNLNLITIDFVKHGKNRYTYYFVLQLYDKINNIVLNILAV